MARAKSISVKQKTLMHLAGVDEVTGTISDLITNASAQKIKDAYLAAGKVVWKQAKKNIQGLPISERGKQQLDATVIINRLRPWDPKVLVGCVQPAGIRKLEKKGVEVARYEKGKRKTPGLFVGNPYWWEFGTSRGQKATPFFRTAVSSSRPAVKKVLTEQIYEALFGDLD